MTIITKPSIEKAFKLPLPLGLGGMGKDHLEKSLLGPKAYLPQNGSIGGTDVESVHYTHPPAFNCIKNGLTILLIFITILLGMFGGYFIYRSFGPTDQPTKFHYRTLCDVPYEYTSNQTAPRFYPQSDDFDLSFNWLLPRLTGRNFDSNMMNDDDFFREEIEMDISDDESYTKIDVPDFKDGRHGRFMHDFKENQSAIIDTTANRCFIMPLDRNTTLPPKSFIDLMEKMSSGYYNIDTDRVRRNMRVIVPPITDLTTISERIANECYDMKVYKLESYVSGVFKRDAKPLTEQGKFAEYSGKGIVEFDIVNIGELEEYERQHLK